eukprot:365720-Chlamydomonas_euryale.AAC.27
MLNGKSPGCAGMWRSGSQTARVWQQRRPLAAGCSRPPTACPARRPRTPARAHASPPPALRDHASPVLHTRRALCARRTVALFHAAARTSPVVPVCRVVHAAMAVAALRLGGVAFAAAAAAASARPQCATDRGGGGCSSRSSACARGRRSAPVRPRAATLARARRGAVPAAHLPRRQRGCRGAAAGAPRARANAKAAGVAAELHAGRVAATQAAGNAVLVGVAEAAARPCTRKRRRRLGVGAAAGGGGRCGAHLPAAAASSASTVCGDAVAARCVGCRLGHHPHCGSRCRRGRAPLALGVPSPHPSVHALQVGDKVGRGAHARREHAAPEALAQRRQLAPRRSLRVPDSQLHILVLAGRHPALGATRRRQQRHAHVVRVAATL